MEMTNKMLVALLLDYCLSALMVVSNANHLIVNTQYEQKETILMLRESISLSCSWYNFID